MAECLQCKAETELHYQGEAICLDCDAARSNSTDRKADPGGLDLQGSDHEPLARAQGA